MLLDVTVDYKADLFQEMYASDLDWFTFINNDAVRAYYFGYLLGYLCDLFREEKLSNIDPDEELKPVKWGIRKYKAQVLFWNDKYLKEHSNVTLTEVNSYILEKIVTENNIDLLGIATYLGRQAFLKVSKALQENEKSENLH